MSTITFYGSSDDLVDVEGDIPGCDEYNIEMTTFEDAGLRVQVEFLAQGRWGITVVQIDEDTPVTATNVHFEMREPDTNEAALRGEAPLHPPYSVRLVMDVPDDSQVRELV
jgi:hypothetical protein